MTTRDAAPAATDLPVPVRDAVERLVAAFAPERIWLYGSRARGDHHEGSDWDLVMVLPDARPRPARADVFAAARADGAPVDVQVMHHASFHDRLHLRASFPSAIVRDGRIVYQEVDMGVTDARRWIEWARRNLMSAQILLSATPPQIPNATFLHQQAVERAGKALLALADTPIAKTHDAGGIASALADSHPDLAERIAALTDLSNLGQGLRYPSDLVAPDLPTARANQAVVAALVDAAAARVEGAAAG
jgi:predicted nucleotidyltransferase/HEPN domain-containing protein